MTRKHPYTYFTVCGVHARKQLTTVSKQLCGKSPQDTILPLREEVLSGPTSSPLWTRHPRYVPRPGAGRRADGLPTEPSQQHGAPGWMKLMWPRTV